VEYKQAARSEDMNRIRLGFRRLIAYAASGVALLALALFLRALFVAQSQPAAGVSGLAEAPGGTTFSEPGDDIQPAWSSDGRYLAYVSILDRYGSPTLYVRDLQTSAKTSIAATAHTPAWSPAGLKLAYLRPSSGGLPLDLYVTDLAGLQHVRVNDVPDPVQLLWMPDGESLLFSAPDSSLHIVSAGGQPVRTIQPIGVQYFTATRVSPDGARALGIGAGADGLTGLVSVDLQSGEATTLGMPGAGGGAWAPDGEHIAFLTPDPNPSLGNSLYVFSLDSPPLRLPGLDPGEAVGQYTWSSDSRYIAYTTGFGLTGGKLIVARADASLVAAFPFAQVSALAWSPDGSQMALSVKVGEQYDIAIIPADEASLAALQAALQVTPTPPPPPFQPSPSQTPSGLVTPAPTSTPPHGKDFYHLFQLTTSATGEYRPAVSPDGKRILFASERDGNWDIYLFDWPTFSQTRLTDDPLPDMSPSWSPDGTRIAYQHNVPDAGGPVLVEHMVMNSDGSNKTIVSSGAAWNGNEPPAWSPDGTRIAFSDGSGVKVVSVAGGREVVRFAHPDAVAYYQPAWIDDGRVAFTGDGQIRIGEVSSGAVSMVFGTSGFAQLPLWSGTLSRLAYFSLEGGSARLLSARPDGSEPYTLAEFSAGSIGHAAWSPDGRFIAYQTDRDVRVAIAEMPGYRAGAPLFSIAPNTSPSDLLSVSWLSNSSGFVFVGAIDGMPELYLAELNEEAIRAYLASAPPAPPTQAPMPPPPTAQPVPPPWNIDGLTPTPTPLTVPPAGAPPHWVLLTHQAQGHQVAAFGDDVWIIDLSAGPAHSADGGARWSNVGLDNSIRRIDLSPNYAVDRAVVATGSSGAYFSPDDGATWQKIPPGGYGYVAFAGDGTLLGTTGDGYDVLQREGGSLRPIAHRTAPGGAALVVPSPEYTADGVVYVVNAGGLWRSRDRGGPWENVADDFIVDVAVDPSTPSRLYLIAGDTTMYRLEDYGAWRSEPLVANVATVAVKPDGSVLAGSADGRVYESTDGGASWLEISTFSGEWIADLVATHDVIYVLTSTGLVGGYRWDAPIPAATPGALYTPTP
jgi:Tol biopolymer transport system component